MVFDAYIDLCSGMGCFPYALRQAGVEIKNHYFSEIDKHAIANYKYNFPNAKHIGSVQSVRESGITSADLITFGWPCQGNSIAGKRTGLTGSTGSELLFEICRILQYIKPSNFIAENVKGLLSVNEGLDIVQAIGLLSFVYEDSPQYNLEYELCNTRHFGIPQNRERIYFVGHLGTGSCRQIFPLGNCIEQDNAPELQRPDYCGTISNKNNSGQLNVDSGTVLVLSDSAHNRQWEVKESLSAIRVGGDQQCIILNDKSRNQDFKESDTVNTIRSEMHGNVPVIIQRERGNNKGGEFEEAPTITGSAWQQNNLVQIPETSGAADAQRIYEPNIARTIKGEAGGQGGKTGLYIIGKKVRRLTPVEVERCFGMPDNWTKYGINEKGEIFEISDTQRYKLCGNSISHEPLLTIIKKLYDRRE